MHADHVMVMALVTVDESIEPRLFLLPREDVEVHDVWHTSGMRGTGSNDIEVRTASCLFHRSVAMADLTEGRSPAHGSTAARSTGSPSSRCSRSPGPRRAGRGRGRARPVRGADADPGDDLHRRKQRDLMSGQIRLAKATADLAAARLLLEDAVRDLMAALPVGPARPHPERARSRLVAAHVAGVARTIVNELCASGGAGVQFAGLALPAGAAGREHDLGARGLRRRRHVRPVRQDGAGSTRSPDPRVNGVRWGLNEVR